MVYLAYYKIKAAWRHHGQPAAKARAASSVREKRLSIMARAKSSTSIEMMSARSWRNFPLLVKMGQAEPALRNPAGSFSAGTRLCCEACLRQRRRKYLCMIEAAARLSRPSCPGRVFIIVLFKWPCEIAWAATAREYHRRRGSMAP